MSHFAILVAPFALLRGGRSGEAQSSKRHRHETPGRAALKLKRIRAPRRASVFQDFSN
jgi:hypothetical protein